MTENKFDECYPDSMPSSKSKYDNRIAEIIYLLETLRYNSDVTPQAALIALNDIRYFVNRLEREIIKDNQSIDD